MGTFEYIVFAFVMTVFLLAVASVIWGNITDIQVRKRAIKEWEERERRVEDEACEWGKTIVIKAPEPELLPCYYLTAKDADGGPQVIKVWTSACDVVKRYTTHFFGPYRMAEGVDAALLRHRTTDEYIHIPYIQRNDAERLTREQARQLMYKRLSTEEYEKLFPVITYTEDTPALLDGWVAAGENKGKEDA